MIYKDTLYKRLIQSKRWQQLRNKYIKENPYCERCGKLAEVVHHKQNLMAFRSDPEKMEQLAFDEENLMSLCNSCHELIHKEMGKNKNKQQHAEQLHREQVADFWLRSFGVEYKKKYDDDGENG